MLIPANNFRSKCLARSPDNPNKTHNSEKTKYGIAPKLGIYRSQNIANKSTAPRNKGDKIASSDRDVFIN